MLAYSIEEFREESKSFKKGQYKELYKGIEVHVSTVGDLKEFLKNVDDDVTINLLLRGENDLGYLGDCMSVFVSYDPNAPMFHIQTELEDIG